MAVTALAAIPYFAAYALGSDSASDVGRALKVQEAPHPGDVAETALHGAVNGLVLYGVMRLFGARPSVALGASASISVFLQAGMIAHGYKHGPTTKTKIAAP